MGKHGKKSQSRVAEKCLWKKVPSSVKTQMNQHVQKLLNKCTNVEINPNKLDWEELKEIHALLQEIKEFEKDFVPNFSNRSESLDAFYSWCTQHGAEFSAVKVKEVSDGNYGVIAENHLQENEVFLRIPRKLMMTVNSAKESKLVALIDKDPILQHMPNVTIALHLLMEFFNPDSFWKPYISVLPSHYDTILYFTVEELQQLQGSPALGDVFKIYRSVARQYAYFHQLFQRDSYGKALDLGHYFTYEMYRWAVSTIMTRQNHIPSVDGDTQITALVPFWDMCNHHEGKFSADFNLKKDCLESYSMQNYNPGEEVCIFYGSRSNAEFFVHNAFVYPDNENDSVVLKLGISKGDPLCSLKCELCSTLGVVSSGNFHLWKNSSLKSDLLDFVKVNVMTENELKLCLKSKSLSECELFNDKELMSRAITFLKNRLSLLLKCYKTTIQEDEVLLSSATSVRNYMAIQLRLCEKKILSSAFNSCDAVINS